MPRRGKFLGKAVPLLKLYMAEQDRAITSRDVAEFLDVTESTANNVLLYMEAIGIISHVRRGREYLYFLKGTSYEVLPRVVSRKSKRRKHIRVERIAPVESIVENYPDAPRDMIPALAIIGLYQTESEPQTQPQYLKLVENERIVTPPCITVERHGRVRILPKEARLLSRGHTNYLKERYLSELDGYENIERFDCFFVESSALERKVYGKVFYVSMGMNPWAKLYKVIVKMKKEGE